MTAPFVDIEFLHAHPEAVIADVRWYLDGRDGKAAYEEGHIPDAVWVDLDHQLAATKRPAWEGRHPFPTPKAFAKSMGSLGIGDGTLVVAYDDSGGLTAARLVVMLRMLGHEAAVLAGGLSAWTAPLDTGPGRKPTRAEFTPRDWPVDRLADADDVVAAVAGGGAVLDARSYERFSGRVSQIDKRPGHIPGARSAYWSEVLDDNLAPRSPDELRCYYELLGAEKAEDTIAYCGSGVSACMNVLAMERAGIGTPRLYVASWSGWSADPNREAATGD